MSHVHLAVQLYTVYQIMDYQAYLLRLHRSQDPNAWRASIENAHTGDVKHFSDELAMIQFVLGLITDKSATQNHDSANSLSNMRRIEQDPEG